MELQALTEKSKKRVGRGHGSGRVKTSGRGTKGQKARGKVKLHFEGGALPLIKRLPFHRGKGRNNVFLRQPIVVNVGFLEVLSDKTIVDVKTLIEHKIVSSDAQVYGVKILGDGELSKALTIKLAVSKGALAKIEKAGGKVEL
jgi:large subunit ribosomal protein L15